MSNKESQDQLSQKLDPVEQKDKETNPVTPLSEEKLETVDEP